MPGEIFFMPETSDDLPSPPEPPDIVIYWRWFTDYLSREGKVIREAKAIFGAAALVLTAGAAWVTWKAAGSLYEERAVVLEKTIEYQKTQIDDLRNRVQTVAPATTISHVQVITFLLKYSPATPESKRPFVNFGFLNISPVPGRGPSAKGYLKVFDNILTAEEEDKIILDLKTEANQANPKLATNQLGYGEYHVNTAFNRDESDDEKIEAVKEGKKYLYAFFVGQFTDDNQPKDEKYVIERCAIFFSTMDFPAACHGHSQVYIEKIK
jgi:hypothetical protein